jgi:uncharacterized protein (DUF1330 family)
VAFQEHSRTFSTGSSRKELTESQSRMATGNQPAPVVHGQPPFPDAEENPAAEPIHTFHVGLWFGSPDAAVAAGCRRFIVRGTAAKAYERGKEMRTVVVEFDSLEKAIAAHDGADYQAALKVLGDGAARDFRIVEGAARPGRRAGIGSRLSRGGDPHSGFGPTSAGAFEASRCASRCTVPREGAAEN